MYRDKDFALRPLEESLEDLDAAAEASGGRIEKLFVADKRRNGADPNLKIVASSVQISEDENLNRDRKYVLKLVAKQGKKDVTLATTKFSTK